MKLALSLIAAVACTPAIAQQNYDEFVGDGKCDFTPDGIAILVGYKHIGATVDFEEGVQPGLFVIWECEGLVETRAGIYPNSFGDTSVALNWKSDMVSVDIGPINAAPFIGLAHYPENHSKWEGIVPMFGFEATSDALPIFAQILPASPEHMGFKYLVTTGVSWSW